MLDFDVVDETVPGGETGLIAASPVAYIGVRRFDMGI
jgi:hypothetical protein